MTPENEFLSPKTFSMSRSFLMGNIFRTFVSLSETCLKQIFMIICSLSETSLGLAMPMQLINDEILTWIALFLEDP